MSGAGSLSTTVERFGDEIKRRLPYLQAYCRKLTGSSWEAEDLVQETSIRFTNRHGT